MFRRIDKVYDPYSGEPMDQIITRMIGTINELVERVNFITESHVRVVKGLAGEED